LSNPVEQYRDSTNLTTRIDLHRRFSTNPYGWQRWVFDQLELPPRCRIVELGCGTAALWRENLERIPPGWEVTLTDSSPGMLEEARRGLSGQPGFSFDVIDARRTPWKLPEASLDAVLANHMLFYVTDRAAAFAEMRRVLKPGGRLYATTVGESNLAEIPVLVQGLHPTLTSWEKTKLGFTLENGTAQLGGWFSSVTVRRYEDSLRVTEVEPLVRYILSAEPQHDAELERRVRERVQRAMAGHGGELRIRKDVGMFVCVAPGD
jgi:ubiquinone/menaquinone biosynthesis C-methylase UbiE